MPMFDDPKKELNRLQRQLLAEEEPEQEPDFYEEYMDEDAWLDEEIAEAKALLGYDELEEEPPVRNYANGYGKKTPRQPAGYETSPSRPAYRGHVNDYEEEIQEEPAENLRGLVILAWLLTLGIVAVAAYWVVLLL